MQFVSNGPDLPDALLQAHEDGRVVFFCGAGISYLAGLPGFQGLVDEIYSRVGTSPSDIEQEAYNRKQFDATLDLLERRLPGQRLAVRKAVVQALKPNLRRGGASDTHSALLHLARNRKGDLRLVTTNFDRIFEWVAKRDRAPINAHAAPMLPIPKNSRWNGLVYLHGLLPKDSDDSALHRLVLTSGDFGLAYLTERWAARFVSELFRNYVVCFVGYSINDPVLRYMMDALAADRMLGEVTPPAYALADCKPGQESVKTNEWASKGVAPILYEVPAQSPDHSALHRTLKAWAKIYRDGILGKERMVVDYARTRPSASTRQDDFVGRMLWALSDESGLPAKRFAEFDPVPPLDWLEAFSDERYQHADLDRFGFPPRTQVDDKLGFSLIRRPAPYTHAPWMSLVSNGAANSHLDHVMFHLARWLVRHLNDPALIIWLAERGGVLHDRLCGLIEHELDRFARMEQEGKTTELDEVRANAPNAIPELLQRKLWRLLLTGRVKTSLRKRDLYVWKDRLKRDGLTATLRLQLCKLLTPKVVLKKPLPWGDSDTQAASPKSLTALVDWELVLAADRVHSWLRHVANSEDWHRALPGLLDDFQHLLRDALDLFRELDEADEQSDRSHWHLRSISPHRQNRGFRDWVALIELLRDAWLATQKIDPEGASRIAQGWFALPYPTFKRMALFAASHDGCIAGEQWVDWLGANDAWSLWSANTRRETMRLLVLQGAKLTPEARERLESSILAGPPCPKSTRDIEPARWQQYVDYSAWLRLAKLRDGGSHLGVMALQRLNELSQANREWRLASNQRDEFAFWMSTTGEPDFESIRDVDVAPRTRQDLVNWLRQPPSSQRPFYEDTWRETCRTHLSLCLRALCDLGQEAVWPPERWSEALYAWTGKDQTRRSWRFAAPLVQAMPDDVLQEIAHAVTHWLEAVSASIDRHETILLDLCRRLLAMPHRDGVDSDAPVTRAINHPIGHVTQALLNLWFKREPNDNDNLPKDVQPLFTQLCDARVTQFRHGRVLLAANVIPLFRVDRSWTAKHLLPLFNWEDPVEAKALWEGFLWSPRLYEPLLISFKADFLSTARHYDELGEHGRQFAAFLTYAALDPVEGYSTQDFQEAIGALPKEGLQEVAHALLQALEAAGEQREEYWKNRVLPFLHQVWPKSRELFSDGIAESLALLSIEAGDEFPSALSAVVDWLLPIEWPHDVLDRLSNSGLAPRFPEDALQLLGALLNDNSREPSDLRQCLTAIKATRPDLEKDPRFRRLELLSRQYGN